MTASRAGIPAVFGGDIHGEKTVTVSADGDDFAVVTINYDNGHVRVVEDGGIYETSLYEVARRLESMISTMSDMQRSELFARTQAGPYSTTSDSDICRMLLDGVNFVHGTAWEIALTMIGHPFIGAIVVRGQSYFWEWLKTHC